MTAAEPAAPSLACRGVAARRGAVQLRDVNLTLYPGQCIQIRGETGSGRSLLMDVCAGLAPPEAGEVHLLGRRLDPKIGSRPLRDQIGVVFQVPHPIRNMTLFENVVLPRLYHRREKPQETEAAARGLLERFDLWEKRKLRPAELSPLERRKLDLVRALICEPKLLFLDSIIDALPKAERPALIDFLREKKAKGLSILVVENGGEASSLADSIFLLADARLYEQTDGN